MLTERPASDKSVAAMHPLQLQRLGLVMDARARQSDGGGRRVEPSIGARSRRTSLSISFPGWLVARGNYSRIGIAQVRFNEAGDPVGVDRLGIALEPVADYELRPDGGGCEDPTELKVVNHPHGDEMDAYERLLSDAMVGDGALFAGQDGVEAAWQWFNPS